MLEAQFADEPNEVAACATKTSGFHFSPQRNLFGDRYEARCQFTGVGTRSEKCDFAIPDRHRLLILIEAKAYGATGSKQTDVVRTA